jgi:hypothetical protein
MACEKCLSPLKGLLADILVYQQAPVTFEMKWLFDVMEYKDGVLSCKYCNEIYHEPWN